MVFVFLKTNEIELI